jgi:hypothetical protein
MSCFPSCPPQPFICTPTTTKKMCGGSRARRMYTTTEEVALEDQPARYASTYGTAAYGGGDLVYANGAYGRNGAVVNYSPGWYGNGVYGNGGYRHRHRHRRGNCITGCEYIQHSGGRYDPGGGVSRLPSNLVSLIYVLLPLFSFHTARTPLDTKRPR